MQWTISTYDRKKNWKPGLKLRDIPLDHATNERGCVITKRGQSAKDNCTVFEYSCGEVEFIFSAYQLGAMGRGEYASVDNLELRALGPKCEVSIHDVTKLKMLDLEQKKLVLEEISDFLTTAYESFPGAIEPFPREVELHPVFVKALWSCLRHRKTRGAEND
jgi:hypothetical protein